MHYYGCTCAKALRQPEPQAGILANVGRGGNLLPELVGSLPKVGREGPKLTGILSNVEREEPKLVGILANVGRHQSW